MTILTRDVKREWKIWSFLDFISKFGLEKQILKDFDDVIDVQEVYDSKYFSADEEHIEKYLEEDERKFTITYVETRSEDYWLICEVK